MEGKVYRVGMGLKKKGGARFAGEDCGRLPAAGCVERGGKKFRGFRGEGIALRAMSFIASVTGLPFVPTVLHGEVL